MVCPKCPYCQEFFARSRYHPEQVVCSRPDCQRRRKTEYRRQKERADPEYARIVADSRKKWRQEHPDYMRRYRQSRQARPKSDRPSARDLKHIESLLERVRNGSAFNLRHSAADIWLISAPSAGPEKNIFASVDLIVIEAVLHVARSQRP
jgi:hypothetical protein